MEKVSDPNVLEPILNKDWPWAGFAIGDLEPDWLPHCEWRRFGDTVLLLFNGLTPRLLSAYGDVAGLANMLPSVGDERVWANIHPDFENTFLNFYRPVKTVRMLRMFYEGNVTGGAEAVRLMPSDSVEIQDLLKHGEWVLFVKRSLEDGHFHGMRDSSGRLVAVAGTHIATRRYNMAALGSVFTHPAHRGQGLATICCRAVLASVAAAGITRVVLNVEEEKRGARRIYEHLGFITACTYLDGECVRIAHCARR